MSHKTLYIKQVLHALSLDWCFRELYQAYEKQWISSEKYQQLRDKIKKAAGTINGSIVFGPNLKARLEDQEDPRCETIDGYLNAHKKLIEFFRSREQINNININSVVFNEFEQAFRQFEKRYSELSTLEDCVTLVRCSCNFDDIYSITVVAANSGWDDKTKQLREEIPTLLRQLESIVAQLKATLTYQELDRILRSILEQKLPLKLELLELYGAARSFDNFCSAWFSDPSVIKESPAVQERCILALEGLKNAHSAAFKNPKSS